MPDDRAAKLRLAFLQGINLFNNFLGKVVRLGGFKDFFDQGIFLRQQAE
jgi:hypothetical protein